MLRLNGCLEFDAPYSVITLFIKWRILHLSVPIMLNVKLVGEMHLIVELYNG